MATNAGGGCVPRQPRPDDEIVMSPEKKTNVFDNYCARLSGLTETELKKHMEYFGRAIGEVERNIKNIYDTARTHIGTAHPAMRDIAPAWRDFFCKTTHDIFVKNSKEGILWITGGALNAHRPIYDSLAELRGELDDAANNLKILNKTRQLLGLERLKRKRAGRA